MSCDVYTFGDETIMQKLPSWRAWVLMATLLMALIPASAFAAPRIQGSSYAGSVIQTFTNCGLTQIIGIVSDESGNPLTGVTIRVWIPGSTYNVTTTSGSYVRDTTNASGWDMFLSNGPRAGDWHVAAVDGNGNLISNELVVQTAGNCDSGAANVVKVEFKRGGASTPPPSGGGTTPPPAPPTGGGSAPNTEAAPPLTPGASCLWFTQTAGGSGGFSVCDDGNARFRTAFNRYGLQNIGYPISTRFRRDGFITQAFQKAVLQWRPDGNYVAFVNVFDELHTRGFDQRLLETRQTPYQFADGWDTPGATFAQIRARREALVNARPAIRRAYFAASDPFTFFGLPTSEVTDMGNHYAIRTQRAVLQEWKETVPWAQAGQVTIANGGDIAKELGHLPAANLTPESAPPSGSTGGTTSAPPSGGTTAPPPSNPGGFRYGIQAHMIYVDKGPIYSGTKGLGFTWIKQQIEWKVWEPQQGQIQWGEMDAIVEGARANGVTMLFSVVGAPGWAREPGYDPNVAGPPQDPNTFANFLGAVAGRYCNNGVGAIEVWNEQNLHYEWGNRPLDPNAYVALLRPSYAKIKEACPSMIVVSGALTPAGNVGSLAVDDFTYLEGMMRAGAGNYADAIGTHPSGFNVPPNLNHTQACAYIQQTGSSFTGPCDSPHHSWSFRSTVDGYYDIMSRNGAGSKRLWATEFGWAAGGAFHPNYGYANDNTLQEQAEWTVQAFQYMRDSNKVGAAFLWNLNFRQIADGTEKAQWGILANNGQPMPAYQALQAMPK
jgi:hypothetical protein